MSPAADRIERRLAALETVQETSWILTSVRSRTALADLALDAVLRASSARAAVLVLAGDGDGGQLQAVAASPGYKDLLPALTPTVLEYLLTAEAVAKREMTRRSPLREPEEDELHFLAEQGFCGVCNIPLTARGQCAGAVMLLYDSGRSLGTEATRPLRILARQVAAALRNLDAFEQIKDELAQTQSRLAAMIESARVLTNTTEPVAVGQGVLAQIRRIFPYEAGWLILLARDGDGVEVVSHLRPDGFYDAQPSHELHAISRWTIETGLPYLAGDPDKDKDAAFCDDLAHVIDGPVRSALCVPLTFGDTVLGTIELVNKRDGTPFSNDDIETLADFASQAALAVKTALLLQETKELAIRDSLTGLYNRRHLVEMLEREMARHRRYGTELSIIIIDVDRFKEINDTRGHAAGDEVLQMLGQTFAGSVRDVDIAARLGGDEFAMLLPNTPLDGAVEVMKRLRRLALGAEPPGAATGVRVSVSQGASEAGGGNAADASALIMEADAALYAAKAAGNGLFAAHGRGLLVAPDAPAESVAHAVVSAV